MAGNTACVELRGISKQYPGSEKKANNNISLDLRQSEILCIAGENGAGKTTLMKILCGLETPDSGEIFINGKKEKINSPLAAGRLKIGMVHQHFMLFSEYTAAENVVMGLEPRKWGFFYDAKEAAKQTDKIIEEHNFSIKSGQKVKDLSLGQMQQVEICRMLYRNAQIIILDEPTSILTEQETSGFFKTLKSLVNEGKSLILITHKLHEIKQLCDRVAVLRRGELAALRDSADIDEYEIARLMFSGDKNAFEIPKTPKKNAAHGGEPVIKFDNVTVLRKKQETPLLDRVSFSLNAGEILAFAGVGGNGLGVLEAVLGGFLHPASGKILLCGRDISSLGTRALRNLGLAYVPADRLRLGSAGEATIKENMIINRRREFIKGIAFNRNDMDKFSERLAEDYGIEGDAPIKKIVREKASSLSGGNLQKLILAREINWLKDYIVFSEPTWGLDIASSGFIMEEIQKLKSKGAAIILISTNLEEIIALADRIIVMYRGKISGEFVIAGAGGDSIKEEIGNCMQGLSRGKK